MFIKFSYLKYILNQNCFHAIVNRTMIIVSNKNIKFSIFTHIEKCAGMSLSKLFNIHKSNKFNNLEKRHNTVEEDMSILKNFFKKIDTNHVLFFTCLRNPWDRMVSFYHYIRELDINKSHKDWSKYHEICKKNTFTDFILYAHDYPNYIGACKPYKKRLLYKKKFICDYVINYHNIYDDIKFLKNIFLIHDNLTIMNSSKHKNYKFYYNSKSEEIIKKIFKDDIDLFNFSFDNPKQIKKPKININKINSFIIESPFKKNFKIL